jgi:Putative DNA-binding domain
MNQSVFRESLLDPAQPRPEGLRNPSGTPPLRRFDVYRNNVAVGLKEALAVAFPVVRQLVGEEFFTGSADVFFRAHPPDSPLLMQYGAGFPDFLAQFPPAASLGYLPDVARLEWLIRESYHAADAEVLPRSAWQSVSADALAQARFDFSPALRILVSSWPVFSIWAANRKGTAPPQTRTGEDVLVIRAAFDPEPHLLPAGSGPVMSALLSGATLAAALDAAGDRFDLTAFLGALTLPGVAARILTKE